MKKQIKFPKRVIRFMNLDDPFHDATVSLPGIPMKFSRRTEVALMLWALIFFSPALVILILDLLGMGTSYFKLH